MYKIVGITSCPTGIAHTYMTAKALTNEAKKYGIKARFETQGQLGPENVVSQQEFDEADAIVLCCGVLPINPERYAKHMDKIINVDYNVALHKPGVMITAMKEAGLIPQELKKQ